MQEDPIQILEVRPSGPSQVVMITAALSASAHHAIQIALAEQLDRRRRRPIERAEDALALREQVALLERFEPLSSATAHTVAQFTQAELRACLLDLTEWADRMNGEHFQSPELRDRLQTVAQLTAALWEVTAAPAADSGEALAVAPN